MPFYTSFTQALTNEYVKVMHELSMLALEYWYVLHLVQALDRRLHADGL